MRYERLAGKAQPEVPTLGDVLSATEIKWGKPEVKWVELLQRMGNGDRDAFEALYLCTCRFVLALMKAITRDAATAEAATMSLFEDLQRRAAAYDPKVDTVLSWIMNQARAKAIELGSIQVEGAREVLPGASEAVSRLKKPSSVTPIESETALHEVRAGLSCKVLATDVEGTRLSMFVRLAAGAEYPPHTHAGIEQLHLLLGELWIDDRKLYPGDYNRSSPDTSDKRVWSEHGCSCILVTSSADEFH